MLLLISTERPDFNKQENSPTKDVDGKLEELQKQLLQKANRNEQYDDLVEEIYKLREEKQQILADKAEMEGVKQSIFNMKAFLNSQTTEIEEYDGQLVRRLIAKVTVYDERFEVELKSARYALPAPPGLYSFFHITPLSHPM